MDLSCKILAASQRIAVLGMSADPARTSHVIALAMQAAGYEIVPVNPKHQEIEGMKCYADLGSIEGQVDIVDVFRAGEHQQAVADAVLAMALKPRAVWFQLNAGGFEVEEQIRAEGIACFVASCIRVAWTACQGRR